MTEAAHGRLGPPPTRRPRRLILHLPCSCVPPVGPAALVTQTRLLMFCHDITDVVGIAFVHQVFPQLVGQWSRLNNAVPSVQSPCRTFLPPTNRSAPCAQPPVLSPLCSASVLWSSRFQSIGFLRLHRNDRFSRFIRKPRSSSDQTRSLWRSNGRIRMLYTYGFRPT